MTCQLTEGNHAADMDVITSFDEKTGRFSLYTKDVYVYNREDLHMRVTCTSAESNSVVTDEVTIQIRRDLKNITRKEAKRSLRRKLATGSTDPADWTIRWPDCEPTLNTDHIYTANDDIYVLGVDGDRYMDPIPDFEFNPFCAGIDASAIQYSAT